MGICGCREGANNFFRGISPFEAVAAMRTHLFFSLRGFLEGCWRIFFFLFRDRGVVSVCGCWRKGENGISCGEGGGSWCFGER